MAAGDGLLLRVRPWLGALSATQAQVIAEVSREFGNGAIDLTNRANLQLRGYRERDWRAALDRLVAARIVDPAPDHDARPAVIVTPEWRFGDDSHRLAVELMARLDEFPPLPPKMGIAIDAGAATALGNVSVDFRLERGENGGIILRADGRATGLVLAAGQEIDALIDIACWFVASGGCEAGRMRRHHAALPGWSAGVARPAGGGVPPEPGPHSLGAVIGFPFGRIEADDLAGLAALHGLQGLRLTPWRKLLMEGMSFADPVLPVSDPNLLRVDACVGAPCCPQASVATRDLATRLARHVAGDLHVSGCAKGCARLRPADIVVTGRNGRFDLARNARAGAEPDVAGLTADEVLARFESHAHAA